MALKKLKNENKLVVCFLIATVIILGVSAYFLYSSTIDDEMGGILISSMIVFISGYGIIVFINRLFKYSFLAKLQNAILVENIRSVQTLQEKFGKSEKRICKDIQFMENSGYLGELKLQAGGTIYSDMEIREYKAAEQAKLIKKIELEEKAIEDKKASKTQKKQDIKTQKCPNCGAKINFNDTNETNCPYCGNILTR